MEEETHIIFKISDLIQRNRPFTAASSLTPSRPIKPHKNCNKNQHNKPFSQAHQNTTPQTLKPLSHTAIIIGTVKLPDNSTIECSCLQFSDDSGSVCCDVLDFDPKMIGRKIRICAWNFIPSLKLGFLEIIRWVFLQSCLEDARSFSSICLDSGSGDTKENLKGNTTIFGVIESISPLFIVSCAIGESSLKNNSGFLVNVLVCECKFCSSNFLVSSLNGMNEECANKHSFVKKVIIYFCGLSSSWHPVISRLIGEIVLLSRLKKKLVFIGKEESQLMYVITTDEVSLHIPNSFLKSSFIRNKDIKSRCEYGSYTGIITGVYMQGMVVELDQNVMLLLTDQRLIVPHSLRLGAIVTVRNVHFVDPKFSWGKMLILGACCRTSVQLKSFSPLETGCYSKSHSHSLLQKFIDSLNFSPRLWVLLIISCFRTKFAGILSEKDILGSKNTEGLAQKYANSHLALSDFQLRHIVMVEFCKHETCFGGKKIHYGNLNLVLPIANLVSYCEASWQNIIDDSENCSNFDRGKLVSCGGRFYLQSTRTVLNTEEIGVLVVGSLKISSCSGRLQLVDATGQVDCIINLPPTWNFDRIFEANGFKVIMEGIPQKLVHSNSLPENSLTCRSIFSTTPLFRKMEISPYLYDSKSVDDYRSFQSSIFFDWKGNFPVLETGKFHLLKLTHKFPIWQKFQGYQSKSRNLFAEAIVLPWDLLVTEKHVENFAELEKKFIHKRRKIDQDSIEATKNISSSPNYLEFPCLIFNKTINYVTRVLSDATISLFLAVNHKVGRYSWSLVRIAFLQTRHFMFTYVIN